MNESYTYPRIPIDSSDPYHQYLRRHKKKHSMARFTSRDTESGKLYKAEWAIESKLKNCSKNISFDTIEDVEKVLKRIIKSNTWSKLTKRRNIYVGFKKKNGRGFAGRAFGGYIELDRKNGNSLYVLLHELAHEAGAMHHGRTFRNNLLALVGAFLGSEIKRALTKEFRKRNLKIGKAPKPLSRESWEKRREQAKQMRMARYNQS